MTDEQMVVPSRKADPDEVIRRYQELHNLEKTGREFGITRERVRQIVNRHGISTARILKARPEKPDALRVGQPVSVFLQPNSASGDGVAKAG